MTSIAPGAFTGSGITTIYGYSDTAAETYASDNSITFIPLAKVSTKRLVLGTDISVRIYAHLSDAEDGAQMRVTMNGNTTVLDGVATGEEPYEYMFTYKGVAPQCLGDDITAALIKGVDVLDDSYAAFSVLSYCKDLLGKTYDELGMTEEKYAAMRTLIADLMEYGAASQLYTAHNTGTLVNADPTIAELTKTAYVAPDASAAKTLTASTDAANVKLVSANVYFSVDNKLMFEFKANGADENFRVKVTYPDTTVRYYTLAECSLVDAETSTYVLYTDSITAPKLSRGASDYFWYTVELKASEGGATIQSLTYSVASYVYAKKDGGNAMADLAKALYTYGRSAYAYLNI